MEHNRHVKLCSVGFPLVMAAMDRIIHEGYNYYYAGGQPQNQGSALGKVVKGGLIGAGGLAAASAIDPDAAEKGLKYLGDKTHAVGDFVQNASGKLGDFGRNLRASVPTETPSNVGGVLPQNSTPQVTTANIQQPATPQVGNAVVQKASMTTTSGGAPTPTQPQQASTPAATQPAAPTTTQRR